MRPHMMRSIRNALERAGLTEQEIRTLHGVVYALRKAPPEEASLIAYLWPLLIVLFSALLPASEVEPVVKSQGLLRQWRSSALEQTLQTVRQQGLAEVRNVLIDGVTALGVPVYNGLGHPVVCIAVIGPHARWQTYAERADAPPAQAWLKEKAAALSAQLGFYPR